MPVPIALISLVCGEDQARYVSSVVSKRLINTINVRPCWCAGEEEEWETPWRVRVISM